MANKKKPATAQCDDWLDEEDDENTVAFRVRELREGKGWSQSQLADKIGVVRSQITRLENGETKNLHSKMLVKLANAFNVTTDYFLGLTDLPRAPKTEIAQLGLSEDAVKKLLSGSIDRDVLNRLLENKEFGTLSKQIHIYFDDTITDGYLGRNELLDYGVTSLRDFAGQNPDKLAEVRDDMLLIGTQKASADEINMDKISRSFQKILRDVRTDIREKKPTTPTMTHDAMKTIQASIADKPRNEVTLDDMTNAVMDVVEGKIALNPGQRKMIERIVRWCMRTFGGKRRNQSHVQFQAYQDLVESLEDVDKRLADTQPGEHQV